MFVRLRTDPVSDVAAAFRDHVRRLERPERSRTEAVRIRIILTRAWRVGLRDRIGHAADDAPRG